MDIVEGNGRIKSLRLASRVLTHVQRWRAQCMWSYIYFGQCTVLIGRMYVDDIVRQNSTITGKGNPMATLTRHNGHGGDAKGLYLCE